ncbi:hypothetical protein Q1695_016232 [Nippostrongylus brasiliensis]|nr:hypothetical protein Q1695_016232 [Nippostrongylus brasiliensis]
MPMESDDDFRSPRPPIPFPAAPRRPEKRGDVQSIPVISVPSSSISADGLKKEFDMNSDSKATGDDTCAVCSKNLTHLNDIRKVAHVNKCLDAQESSRNHEKAKEQWSSTIDCPMCGEPQPPGPHRAAHAKRCGRIYNISPSELLKLMETQRRVSDVKKRNNMLHTRAPPPHKKEVQPKKLTGAPSSLLDENLQLAQALSMSMENKELDVPRRSSPQFTRIVDTNDGRRKRPRSYAVVELAPRACRCEVIERLHDRFLDTFHVRKSSGVKLTTKEAGVRKKNRTSMFMQSQLRLLQKLERLERLSQDLYTLVDQDPTSDVRIKCSDGILNGHRLLLQLRSRILTNSPSQSASSYVEIDETRHIATMWMRYVYSGRVEWSKEEAKDMLKMAEQYGPDDLLSLCSRQLVAEKKGEEICNADSKSALDECSSMDGDLETQTSNVAISAEITSTAETTTIHPVAAVVDVVVPEQLKVDLSESFASANKMETTIDYEDPLQGVVFDRSSTEQSSDDECMIIDDNSPVPKECTAKTTVDPETNLSVGDMCEATLTAGPIGIASGEPSEKGALPEVETSVSVSTSPDLFDNESRNNDEEETRRCDNLTPLRATSFKERSSGSFLFANSASRTIAGEPHSGESSDLAPSCSSGIVAESNSNTASNTQGDDDDIVCVEEKPAPGKSQDDPYANEYFDYHDPFMEPWYDIVEAPFSDPTRTEGSGSSRSTDSRASRRRSSRIAVEPPVTEEAATAGVAITSTSALEKNEVPSHRKDDVQVPSTAKCQPLAPSATDDSFFDSPMFLSNGPSGNRTKPLPTDSDSSSTPLQPVKKKARFGSNVKVLKTSGITPMPNYDGMNDAQLKGELAKYGLKPMGRKRALALLKKIYDEVHPEIDPSTPTIRPLVRETSSGGTPVTSRPTKKTIRRKRAEDVVGGEAMIAEEAETAEVPVQKVVEKEYDDFVDPGDRTLNDSRDGPLEETMIDNGILPKDLDGMTAVFLSWLRRSENDELYNHLLSLQPVLIDELHLRMSREDTAVCAIPKKALANILDRLGVTFSMPQVYGRRRAGAKRK